MRPRALAAAALALAALSCAVPRGTAERPKISAFDVQGVRSVDRGVLQEKLALQPPDPWWKLFWRRATDFDDDALSADRRRVERYYQAEGFYDAKVVESQVVPDGAGRVKVRLRVDEGKPSTVVEVRIDGIEKAPEAQAALRDLPLRVGRRFTEAAFDGTRAKIEQALGTTGYAKGTVEQRAEVNPRSGEVRVVYTVEPGLRYRFGNVFVSGTAAVPRARVRQEAELVLKPGDWFDGTDLEKVQGRIFDLGVFGGVRVTQGPADEAKLSIPVVVSAREAPFRTIRAGPGLGVALNRWDANVSAGWAHRNWLGGLRKLNLDLRLGYAWLPNPFVRTREGPIGLASAEFTQPGAIRQRLDVNTRVELERGIEEAYRFWAERFRVGAPFKYRAVQFAPSYNLQLYQLSDVTGQLGRPGQGGASDLLASCNGASCLLSYFEQRIALDLRDDPINTRRGLYLSLTLQEGFKLFGNGFPYFSLMPEGRFFLPVFKSSTLAGRLRFGSLRSLNATEPPITVRFFSGGPTSMRGYYTRRLSPSIYDPDRRDFVPVGGSGLVDGSLELRVPITGSLGTAIFLDFGDVTQKQVEALDPGNLQYAAGVGLRYKTLFGPLRLDVAGRLPRRSARVGWEMPGVPVLNPADAGGLATHTEPIVSVHLSLGEAF